MRELAAHFLTLAEKQGATVPLMVGHRNMGVSLLHTGDIQEARAHIDRAIILYDPAKLRQLATRFGQDVRVALLFYRSLALWPLGYAERALAEADRAISDAREIGHAARLMAALTLTSLSQIHCGSYAIANAQLDEVITLANEAGAVFLEGGEMCSKVACLPPRQSFGRRTHDHFWTERMACHGSNGMDADVLVIFDESLCGTRPIR